MSYKNISKDDDNQETWILCGNIGKNTFFDHLYDTSALKLQNLYNFYS